MIYIFTAIPDAKQLVDDLCSWLPTDSPPFKEVVVHLQKDDFGNTNSLVDKMISRLETHTQNLESLVDAR